MKEGNSSGIVHDELSSRQIAELQLNSNCFIPSICQDETRRELIGLNKP
jgi:hypothetical protein